LFAEGVGTARIARIKSALVSTLDLLTGEQWTESKLLKQVMKAISRARPVRPRYDEFWDVSKLINHLSSLGECGALSMQALRARTLCLWKLAAVLRSSDLENISRASIRQDDGGDLLFRILWPKQQRQPGLSGERRLEALPASPRICPVANMMELLRRYEAAGVSASDGGDRVWRALKTPFKPIGRECISNIVVAEMAKAGIDTSVYKAHSVKGAAASAALEAGESEETIMKSAVWSSRSVFERFYARRRVIPSVGKAILGCK
jgi:hypothetical protein